MSELSMVETLKLWDEAVSSTERGRYEDALIKFMSLEQLTGDSNQSLITSARNLFNIGQTYFSLDRIDMAVKAFRESLAKDKMLAIAHFMLGCAHLKQKLYKDALQDFDNALFFLRGNRLIDYKQLGLKYKLYSCEILCNKAIAYAYLGKDQQAKNDFLKAVESCVEPRHGAIQDTLICWQKGKGMEPILVPPIAVFQPSKSKLQVTKGAANYLGKSQVVASRVREANEQTESSDVEKSSHVSKEALKPNVVGLFNDRNKLMKDLRNKETRKSLKKTNIIKPNCLEPVSPEIPPPRPTSPHPGKKPVSGVPPTKPLPPPPQSKSPIPFNRRPLPPNPESQTAILPSPARPPKRQGRTVTFELVINRTVQINHDVTTNQLSQAAAKALGVSEDTFTMWFSRDGEMASIDQNSLPSFWKTDGKTTIYCREKR